SSPLQTAGQNSRTFRVKYFCDPNKLDSGDVACFFLGAPAKVYHNAVFGTDVISRLMPQLWPGTERVVATQILGGKGFQFSRTDLTGAFPIAKYTTGEVEILFETAPFDIRSDDRTPNERARYVQRLPTQSEANYLTLPGAAGYKYTVQGGAAPNGKAVPFNIGVTLAQGVIARKWHRLDRSVWSDQNDGTQIWSRVFGDEEAGTIPFVGTVNT